MDLQNVIVVLHDPRYITFLFHRGIETKIGNKLQIIIQTKL